MFINTVLNMAKFAALNLRLNRYTAFHYADSLRYTQNSAGCLFLIKDYLRDLDPTVGAAGRRSPGQ